MLAALLPVPALLSFAAASVAGGPGWSSIVQSGDDQPHTRRGQLQERGPIPWSADVDGRSVSAAVTVIVDSSTRRQQIHGFGGAFTEAAGYVWTNLSAAAQQLVLDEYWGAADGAGYSTGRVAMNSPGEDEGTAFAL
eukprot:SAG22_NODE_1253_length_5001_cov_12.062220_4_plen_137_part_00